MGQLKTHSHTCFVMFITDALTMHLNIVKAITESSAVSLDFLGKPCDTDMQTT